MLILVCLRVRFRRRPGHLLHHLPDLVDPDGSSPPGATAPGWAGIGRGDSLAVGRDSSEVVSIRKILDSAPRKPIMWPSIITGRQGIRPFRIDPSGQRLPRPGRDPAGRTSPFAVGSDGLSKMRIGSHRS